MRGAARGLKMDSTREGGAQVNICELRIGNLGKIGSLGKIGGFSPGPSYHRGDR